MIPEKKIYKSGPVATTYVTKNEYLTLILEDLMDMGFTDILFKNNTFYAVSKHERVNQRLHGTKHRDETHMYIQTHGLLVRIPGDAYRDSRHSNWALADAISVIEANISPERKSYFFRHESDRCPEKYAFLYSPWKRGFVLNESPDFEMLKSYAEITSRTKRIADEWIGIGKTREMIENLQKTLKTTEDNNKNSEASLQLMKQGFERKYGKVSKEDIQRMEKEA
jgi:hypothetical protein